MLRKAMVQGFTQDQSQGDGAVSRERKETKDFHSEPLRPGHLPGHSGVELSRAWVGAQPGQEPCTGVVAALRAKVQESLSASAQ